MPDEGARADAHCGGCPAKPEPRLLHEEDPVPSTTRSTRHATVAAAGVSAAASWAVVTKLAGVHLDVRFPHSSVTTVALGTMIGVASVATLLGWGLLAALETKAPHARRIWITIAVVVFLMSLGLPIAFATTTAAATGLAAIHLVVASVAITGLCRAGHSDRASSSPAARDLSAAA